MTHFKDFIPKRGRFAPMGMGKFFQMSKMLVHRTCRMTSEELNLLWILMLD
jgi:hypothetical protein